ncbi:hypothetical protein [Verrucomicrobium spinosum]|uniref:hypothetical protein n=1 Tax=Verrucomicrobium spinosum TaxID=2736 RepID=UPI00155DA43E|nr:hypothetical protein [Verrucomicrobium spinosum]
MVQAARALCRLLLLGPTSSRSDAFANGWWFEGQPQLTEGQRLHVERNRRQLPEALGKLGRDIPLPDVRWLPLLPVAALAMMFLPSGAVIGLPDPELTAEGRRLAVEQGRELAEKKLDVDKMQSLTEQEKKDAEALQQKVQETAKALQQNEAKTARDVLSELEKRAREAEQLADKLKAGEDAWASARWWRRCASMRTRPNWAMPWPTNQRKRPGTRPRIWRTSCATKS